MSAFEVGQTLWFQPGRWSHLKTGRAVTVKTVGRKWITLTDGDRFDPQTMEIDGGGFSSPGRIWMTKEEGDVAKVADATWEEIKAFTRAEYERPQHLSYDVLTTVLKTMRGER